MVRYVVFYESADDVAAKAPAVFPDHVAWVRGFKERGDLLLVGTFADPQADGAMSVLASREAAEEFATGDPFVRRGVVKAWTLKEWHEAIDEF